MIEFPKSAEYGRKISFAQLKKQGLPARYSEWIKSLVWAYKLSPATMNLAPTATVREIEVMDLTLKEKCSTHRLLATLVSAIDKLIPSPLIFRVFSEEGEYRGVAFNLKSSGGSLCGTSDMFRLFWGEETVDLPSGVVDLESFFKGFASSVAGMQVSVGETLKEFDARHYRREALKADIGEIDRKLAKEIRLDVKYRLMKERQQLEKEMLKCQN